MNAIRRILCPTDFSEFSRRALGHAVALARWKGCELVVLHVRQPAEAAVQATGVRGRARGGAREAVAQDPGRARAEASLRAFVEPELVSGVEMRTVIQDGQEVDEILREVRAQAADLLVMGTHGRGGFERFMLGSVTEQVLRRADCPVLVVPSLHAENEEGEDAPAGAGSPYAHIVCPLDFSETSLAALHQAVRMAREAGARLTVVHAVELPPIRAGEPEAASLTELRRRLSDGAIERVMEALARESWDGMPVDSVVLAGKAYQEILSVAEDLFADLIVMGVSGRADADRALFGSTVQHVTRAAVCPVLTVHAA